jgi:mannosylglycerate hydrolase
MENEYLRVIFNPNGSIRLTNKETGRIYDNLHYFEDAGDVGNYWAYYPPYRDETYTTLGGSARIWHEENGPLSATIGVEYTMILPTYAHEPDYGVRGKSMRSGETVALKITSRFTLTRGARRLEVRTALRNNARNHRLRVAFPTGIDAEFSHAAGHFTVDKRPRVNQPAEDGSYWPEMQTLPMQEFVDVNDNDNGFAVLSNCFTEYEFKNDENATLCLTLFRAMGNLIVTWWEAVGRFDNQDGSQLQREMEFNYAIYPHTGDWQSANTHREAAEFNTKTEAFQLLGQAGQGGNLPSAKSFLSISNPNIGLSALKLAENNKNIILRLINPTDEPQQTEIAMGFNFARVWRCALDESRDDELVTQNGKLEIGLEPQKIMTAEIEIAT